MARNGVKMNKWKLALAAGTAFTLAALAARDLMAQPNRGGWQSEATRHGWLLDYRAARERARESKRPLMVVFRCVP